MKHDNSKFNITLDLLFVFACVFSLLLFYITALPARGEKAEAKVVNPGDRAEVHLICKESTGDIILTTYKAVSDDAAKKKSDIYAKPEAFEPLRIVAGKGEQYSGTDPLKTFNNELAARLSEAIVGMRVGESASLTFKAPVPAGMKKGDRYITLSRIRTLQKTMVRDKSMFSERLRDTLYVGQDFPNAVGLTTKITSIKDEEVTLEYVGSDGDRIETPWGTGILHATDDELKLELNPRVGRLVRTGPYVGRIISVEDKVYTLDFGFPFGNEMIICDISVISIMEQSHDEKM